MNPVAIITKKRDGGKLSADEIAEFMGGFVRGEVPADIRRSMELWVGCIAGALEEREYADKLRSAGFADIEVEPWRIYKIDDARAFLTESGVEVDRLAPEVEDKFASAFVRAKKPDAKSCCGPDCCV